MCKILQNFKDRQIVAILSENWFWSVSNRVILSIAVTTTLPLQGLQRQCGSDSNGKNYPVGD